MSPATHRADADSQARPSQSDPRHPKRMDLFEARVTKRASAPCSRKDRNPTNAAVKFTILKCVSCIRLHKCTPQGATLQQTQTLTCERVSQWARRRCRRWQQQPQQPTICLGGGAGAESSSEKLPSQNHSPRVAPAKHGLQSPLSKPFCELHRGATLLRDLLR